MYRDETLAERADVREQFDRTTSVLGEALFDFAWLFGDVHMKGQVALLGEVRCLGDPIPGHRAHAMGGETDMNIGIVGVAFCERLYIGEDVIDLRVAKP